MRSSAEQHQTQAGIEKSWVGRWPADVSSIAARVHESRQCRRPQYRLNGRLLRSRN
jgi:hypothetical protein